MFKLRFAGSARCAICRREYPLWDVALKEGIVTAAIHNGSAYTNKNLLTRECAVLMKARKMVRK